MGNIDMSEIFTSSIMKVRDEWIDFNGHLNMAYYHVLFDWCVDEVHEEMGLGDTYRRETNASTFTAEAHIVYLREIMAGDEVTITCHLLDASNKASHTLLTMSRADGAFVSAVSEQMHLHVDMATKRVTPFPNNVQAKIDAMLTRHASLPRSPHIGSTIGIRRKAR